MVVSKISNNSTSALEIFILSVVIGRALSKYQNFVKIGEGNGELKNV